MNCLFQSSLLLSLCVSFLSNNHKFPPRQETRKISLDGSRDHCVFKYFSHINMDTDKSLFRKTGKYPLQYLICFFGPLLSSDVQHPVSVFTVSYSTFQQSLTVKSDRSMAKHGVGREGAPFLWTMSLSWAHYCVVWKTCYWKNDVTNSTSFHTYSDVWQKSIHLLLCDLGHVPLLLQPSLPYL